MNIIRATLRLPEELHQELMLAAFNRKISFNDLVKQKLMMVDVKQTDDELNGEIEEELRFLNSIGRKIKAGIGVIDCAKLVREERDRNNA